ncbi:hypothetical protein C8R47DRAFT_220781 [Mycena vitilis]|nr:hypothetical protein C8R47DRAFT_220781 [Mycena vitilis]
MALNIASTLLVPLAVRPMPLNVPSSRTDASQIGVTLSPEDYTPLWRWMSFSWIYPLVKKGTNTTLAERDVYDISPSLQSRPVYTKFSSLNCVRCLSCSTVY